MTLQAHWRILFVVGLILSSLGCRGVTPAQKISVPFENKCRTVSKGQLEAETRAKSEFAQTKLILDASIDRKHKTVGASTMHVLRADSSTSQDLSKPVTMIPAGFEATVIVDLSCWYGLDAEKQQNIKDVFPIKSLRLGERLSTHQSVHVVFERRIEFETVEYFARAHPCIVGVSNAISYFPQQRQNSEADPLENHQRFHSLIRSTSVWESLRADGESDLPVTVAVIDGGVDLEHEDLIQHRWVNSAEIPSNGIDDDRNGFVDDIHGYDFARDRGTSFVRNEVDENFHGTHVAGLMGAVGGNAKGLRGTMGKGLRIMGLNVFGASDKARAADIDNAVRYAADNGAQVINISVGSSGRAPSTELAFRYAISKGATVVVAAGNSSLDVDRNYFTPAMYGGNLNGVLAIASIQTSTSKISSFSNTGNRNIQIAAPGEGGMASTAPDNKYAVAQGTSMAAPVVAGAAAYTYRAYRKMTGAWPSPALVESLILDSATRNADLGPSVEGGRVLDMEALAAKVQELAPVPTSTPAPTPTSTPLTPAPTAVPQPTSAPMPTMAPVLPQPTEVPQLSATPVPTATPEPSVTPEPGEEEDSSLPACP
jgi:hypothetical protein